MNQPEPEERRTRWDSTWIAPAAQPGLTAVHAEAIRHMKAKLRAVADEEISEQWNRAEAAVRRAVTEYDKRQELEQQNVRLRAELEQARGTTGQDTTTPTDGEMPPPEGPEYTPCVCGHIEPEHRIQRPGWTREACRECDCVDYRTVPADGEQETRQQIAAAIHRYDNQHALSGNDIPSDHHRGEADAVLPVVRAALAAERGAVLAEAITAVEDPERRAGLGWESARDVLLRMTTGPAA